MRTAERIPSWLRRPLTERVARGPVRRALGDLNTICQEARCPNRGRCLGEDKTAAFLLMGPGCSRSCKFCAVSRGPAPLDGDEPYKVARAVRTMDLKYVVLTSTTRDDLEDGGAGHLAQAVDTLVVAGLRVEVLVPDFGGRRGAVETVAGTSPAVFGHNVETVPRLYEKARPGADYRRSLDILSWAAEAGALTKSALMVGLGEDPGEVEAVLMDLKSVGVAAVMIGQYLRPGARQLPVARFYGPEEFEALGDEARARGFDAVACAPFVRSSFRADEIYRELKNTRVIAP